MEDKKTEDPQVTEMKEELTEVETELSVVAAPETVLLFDRICRILILVYIFIKKIIYPCAEECIDDYKGESQVKDVAKPVDTTLDPAKKSN